MSNEIPVSPFLARMLGERRGFKKGEWSGMYRSQPVLPRPVMPSFMTAMAMYHNSSMRALSKVLIVSLEDNCLLKKLQS
jgi:hypothetical protein